MNDIKILNEKIAKNYITALLVEYFLFSGLLLYRIHTGFDLHHSFDPVILLGIVSVSVIHVRKFFTYDVRLYWLVGFSFIQIFYCGLNPRLFLTDFPILLGVYLMSLAMTEKFHLICIGAMEYYILAFMYIYQHNSLVLDNITIIPGIVVLAVAIFCRFQIIDRKERFQKYGELIDYYKKRGIESEEYLYNISHELRSEVNTISGVLEIAQQDSELGGKLDRMHLSQNSILRLSGHIEDIMDFSEISSSRFSMVKSDYSIRRMIQWVIDSSSAFNKGRGLELFFDLAPDIPALLSGDEMKVHNIIVRLLEDAIRYTPSGGVYFMAQFKRQDYGGNLLISIEDTGTAIDEAVAERILGSEGLAEGIDEVGLQELDLLLVKKLTESLGGFMKITVKENGKIISISLPHDVSQYRPWMEVGKGELLNPIIFMKQGRIKTGAARDMGGNFMRKTFTSLGIDPTYVSSIQEFYDKLEEGGFTHLFISGYEYAIDPTGFEKIALELPVILINPAEADVGSANIKHLNIPFAIHDLRDLLWGNDYIKSGEGSYAKVFEGLRVLVADHDPVNLLVIADMLTVMGASVEQYRTNTDVINACMENPYDVIFWVYSLPDMDIGDLASRIHSYSDSRNLNTPIIGITARVHSTMNREMEEKGFSSYISMPATMQDFYRSIREAAPKYGKMFPKEDEAVEAALDELPGEYEAVLHKGPSGENNADLHKEPSGKNNTVLHKEPSGENNADKVDVLVTSESVSDIPMELAKKNGIPLISYHLRDADGHVFDEIYEADTDFMLGSSAYNNDLILSEPPSVEQYREFFMEALKSAREVIHVSMMDFMDSGISNAKKAAATLEGVYVVDSGSVSMGLGMIASSAARAAKAGFKREEVIKVIDALRKRLALQFVLPKTGVSRFNSMGLSLIVKICNVLQVYPVVSIREGKFHINEVLRGDWHDIYGDFVYSVMRKGDADDELLVVGTVGLDASQRAQIVHETERYMRFSSITPVKVRSAVGCVVGRGTMGFAYFKKDNI